MPEALTELIARHQARVEAELGALLANIEGHQTPLIEAMRYSLLDGGKRIRAVLTYATAQALGTINPVSDALACAVECIHAYSLVHDDLPAMDDDDLRRGKATCHIAFDEATAILAGDALQCLAFEAITQCHSAPAEQRLRAIETLSQASGMMGMVMGQAIDLAAVNGDPDLDRLALMHRHKTGALIEASVALGAISVDAPDHAKQSLRLYSQAIGLAFQVQDDILDVIADTETLGKQQGADTDRNKPTYVSLLGLEGAKAKAEDLHQQALSALAGFDQRADYLRDLSHYIINRGY